MSDEQIVSIHSSMQFLPTRLPIIVLHRVEEELPVSEIMVGVMSLCAEKKSSAILFQGFVWPKKQNVF